MPSSLLGSSPYNCSGVLSCQDQHNWKVLFRPQPSASHSPREGCIIALASVIYHADQDSTDELPTPLRKSILPTGGYISGSAHTHPGLTLAKDSWHPHSFRTSPVGTPHHLSRLDLQLAIYIFTVHDAITNATTMLSPRHCSTSLPVLYPSWLPGLRLLNPQTIFHTAA